METKNSVDYILRNAIDSKASDIHLEPERDSFDVRFRIDGILYKIESWPRDNQERIVSRIKVLSQLNIMERKLPQDGHFEFNYNNTIYNMRVSTFQTVYGEVIVIRILNRKDILIKLENLGLYKDQLEIVNKLIDRPYGMILITGPSGSGKTILLYSILNKLNKSENNIITLENPIELQMPNIRQSQINEEIGLTFSKGLRAILRQDPNIIMIGEIRDPETAQMAIQAALTGILVFSTFHTLDVPALVTRLIEMGVPRSVVAQSMTGAISSRLVKKICKFCKEPYQLTDRDKFFLGEKYQNYNFYRGKGCDKCRHSGYSGQTGIFEVAYFDDGIRASIIEQKSFSDLKKLLQERKMKTMREAAIGRASQGITTVEEAIRIAGDFLKTKI